MLRLRNGPLRHSVATGIIRSFATGRVATSSPWELPTRAARKTVAGINHTEALVRNHRYWVGGLSGNSYRYRDNLRVRGLGRGMATTAAKDDAGEGFSVKSKLKLANGVTMPKIHFGVYEVKPGEETETAVRDALEAGYRAIDSAQGYYNEESCGKAIKGFLTMHPELTREDIFFTTKLRSNSSYVDTRRAIKSSIEKTGLQYLDLYLLHSPYGGPQKRKESWRAVADAVEDGEIRVGGVSNFGVRHLKELLEREKEQSRRPVVNQIEVHPFNANAEITTFCRENGIQIQAYAPLVKGRKFDHPVIKELSKKYGCTPAQLLVRWSLQMGYVPLPKSVRKERIEANKNVEGIEISEEDMKKLEGLDEGLSTSWNPTNAP
ncbi:hypothetical protein L211DRAFT_833574 [Terfezia boudieri ATCC MYA-4762]|uniref:NADP-dependent oxidoreductase domain-containing protein n=1 Tax=Terfezia boudieri ATCC MYA-4762 TaxID=1051890 RepID=A0A3N4M7L0_9PEZI|nr:hypothetical protein L211DRAFT_833574 [Terfezia boudieri ATCC MYA-4762]